MLAQIANVFSQHQVSIETVEQFAAEGRTTTTLEIETHDATDSSLSSVVKELADTDSVARVTSVIRVEGY